MPDPQPLTAPDCRADLDISEVHHLGGPNRWTYRPVLEAVVDIGMLEDFPSNRIPGFAERLANWLPGLIEHRCSPGVRGGFLHRLREGTWPAHILEHVTLELQTLAGVPTGFGRARETSRRGVYRVIVRAFDEHTARAALAQARELVLAAMPGRVFDVAAAVAHVRAAFAAHGPGAGPTAVALAAETRRIPFLRLDGDDLVQFGHGSRQRRMRAAETDHTSAIAEGISRDADLMRELLRGCGIPVSTGELAAGAGAQEGASPLPRYRLLVVDGRMVAASRTDCAAPDRSDIGRQIHPDLAATAVLAARVIGLDIAGIDLIAEDVARPPQEQRAAIIAVEANPDLTLHLGSAPGVASTVGAAILASLFPGEADGRIPLIGIAGTGGTTAVAHHLFRLLQESGADRDGASGRSRGSENNNDSDSDSDSDSDNRGRRRTGLASADGLFLDDRRIADGDGTRQETARRLLTSPLVDLAVIENGLEVMATQGLAYDRCSIGVVTSFAADARVEAFDVLDQEQVRTVLRTQVDVVLPTGVAVLDAASESIAAMASLCDGETMFFADSPAGDERIDAHLATGGRAVRIEDGFIVLCAGATRIPLTPAQTPGRPSASAWLPAIAAAWATGLTPAQLASRMAALSSIAAGAPAAAAAEPVAVATPA